MRTVNSQPLSSPVVVVGCCFLDHKTRQMEDGTTAHSVHHGGVGRNIAENLTSCGADVRFLTLRPKGGLHPEIYDRLGLTGVQVWGIEARPALGEFRVELDRHGSLLRSSAIPPKVSAFRWNVAERWMQSLPARSWIVLETGLDPAFLERLLDWAKQRSVHVCAVPTQLHRTGPPWNVFHRADCLILNHREAGYVLNTPVSSITEGIAAAGTLFNAGISIVIVTMESQGVVAADPSGPPTHYPAPKAEAVDGTGAGDAFTAALVASLAAARPLSGAIGTALDLARRTVESFESVLPASAIPREAAGRLSRVEHSA